MTLKTKILAFLASIALAIGLASPASASQYASYTSAGQSSSLASRVVYDPTTAFGPVLYTFNSAGTQTGTYLPIGGNLSSSAIFWEWESNWNGSQVVLSGAPVGTFTIGTPSTGGNLIVAQGVLDVLRVAAADGNIEFVITN